MDRARCHAGNYSTAFRRMLEAPDVVAVGDHRPLGRFHYQESDCAPIMSFKAFRNSDAFKLVAPDIAAEYQCSRMESCFTALDMDRPNMGTARGNQDGLKLVTGRLLDKEYRDDRRLLN